MGQRLEVTPDELRDAGRSLGSVSGELGRGELAGGSELGGGELDEALEVLAARLEMLARAADGALGETGRRLGAGADAYAATDAGAMRVGRG